jgi:hypothetical protein
VQLNELTITNCFGFGRTTINLDPQLVYILGRNSSGKTAVLDAIDSVNPNRNPQDQPRFKNFRPTKEQPELDATFIGSNVPAIDITSVFGAPLRRIAPESALADNQSLQKAITALNEEYAELATAINAQQRLVLSKFGENQCQLTAGQQYEQASDRRKRINATINRALPNGIFNYAGANHQVPPITSSDLDRHVARQILPPIYHYREQYNLTDDLPDHLTTALIAAPPSNLANAFIKSLVATDLQTLLTTNDPDEQNQLKVTIQERADRLAGTISRVTTRLIGFTLTLTINGLQITVRTDGKKCFYRQLSDATKFLIAYHIHAEGHDPGAILLFDEPSRGLHASVEHYLREFLERLSGENHVIVTTHSEHLLDLDRLERIRLMQQDQEERPLVLNSLRPPRDRESYLLALQPVWDAIGLAHVHHTITQKRVVITEGLTDYLYLRAFHELTQTNREYGITPGRSDSTMLTLVPFLISQGIMIKIILDDESLKAHIQEAYGIADESIFIIGGTGTTHGIEDVFAARDYLTLLGRAGDSATLDDLRIGNSAYAKRTSKRLVAQTFRTGIGTYDIDSFEVETRLHINDILMFCGNDQWHFT